MKHVIEKFSPVDIDDDASTEEERAFVLHLQEFVAEFRAKGYETRVVHMPDAKAFPEVLFIKRKETEKITEPTVRLYRGIGLHNTGVRQEPYAIRAENTRDERRMSVPHIIEQGRETLEQLLVQPTYHNLVAHMEVMREHWSEREWRTHQKDLREIEDHILEGRTMRSELVWQQFHHNGTHVADSGLAPFVSASYDPEQAAGYGQGSVLILDVPISQIEEFRCDTEDETCIKGTVVEQYITAIAVGRFGQAGRDEQKKELAGLAPRIETVAHRNGYSSQDIQRAREVKYETEAALDAQTWQQDAGEIQEKRMRELLDTYTEYADHERQIQTLAEQESIDVYTAARRYLFDQYAQRFQKAEYRHVSILRQNFEGQDRQRRAFDRSAVTDEMLVHIHHRATYEERSARLREESDRRRASSSNFVQ